MAEVSFKAKIETIYNMDDTVAYRMIKVPALDRKHCDMNAFRRHPKFGSYANSDLFKGILARLKRDRLGESIRLDQVPEGVVVDTSSFLAVVSFDA